MPRSRASTPPVVGRAWAGGIAGLVIAALTTGCPGGHGHAGDPPEPPPFRQTTAAPLPEPPPPEAGKDGLEYLLAVYPALRDGWAAFVNDCRLRLPATDALNNDSLRAELAFVVEPDGALGSVRVVASSGNTDFDQVAVDIVREAAPLPAPPAAVMSDDGVAHVRWAFQRDDRLAGVATATLERVTWPPEKAIPAFIAAGMFDRAVDRLSQAATAGGGDDQLVHLGEVVADAAVEAALAADDGATQRAGIHAAARAHLHGAGTALERLARSAVDADARGEAVAALGAVGAKGSVAFLHKLAAGSDPSMAIAAMRALEALGAGGEARKVLMSALSSGGADAAERRRVALAVAAEVPIAEARPALEKLVASGSDRAVRAAACAALGTVAAAGGDRTSALALLRKQLGTNDAALRAACVRAIDRIARAGGSNRASYWKVVALLRDRDEHVRAAATLASAHLAPARFAKELYQLRHEHSPAVLAALAEALAVVPGKAALHRLLALSRDDEVVVRRAAASALAHRSETAAVARLREMLGDDDPEVQLHALAKADRQAAEGLLQASDPALRAAALVAYFGGQPRAATVGELARLLGATTDPAERARIAGAWLAQ